MNYALEPPREGHIWDFYYDLLIGFVDRKGHTEVSRHHIEKGFALGIWVHKQRNNRQFLRPDRLAALDAIERWFWDTRPAPSLQPNPFVQPTPALRTHSPQPTFSSPPTVANPEPTPVPTETNRRRTIISIDSDNRFVKRSPDGFSNTVAEEVSEEQTKEQIWHARYKLLIQYMNREGHGLVPRTHKEDQYKLGKWVQHQQRMRFAMPKHRRLMLESLEGWRWDAGRKPSAAQDSAEADTDVLARDVWDILWGYGSINDVMAAHITVQRLHDSGVLEESTVRIGSDRLKKISEAFDRCVELGTMDRPELGKIRAVLTDPKCFENEERDMSIQGSAKDTPIDGETTVAKPAEWPK